MHKNKTWHIYCKTSHGKCKSDGVGVVVNSHVSRASNKVICDAEEFYYYFKDNLTVLQSDSDDKAILNCFFVYISEYEIQNFRKHFLHTTTNPSRERERRTT